MSPIPKSGWSGFVENWRSDLIASLSVSLVALPLALGIGLASGTSPMSGVIAAIVGGLVTTFFRGGHIAINGPAAGLIAIILTIIPALDDGSGRVLNYVFAVFVVSGGIQVLMGLLKWGHYAELIHSTIIRGMLAAIGVIIFAKQLHLAFDTSSNSPHIFGVLKDVFLQSPNINPFVAVISLLGFFILFIHPKIKSKVVQLLPAPIWVLICSLPFVFLFNFLEPHSLIFWNRAYDIGPRLLIDIPSNILDAIVLPDFSKINTLPFWTSVLSITIIASIESLAISKAVDKMDPYKRKSDLNKDLVGIGMGTLVSGALGGLPIISVIVRTQVNIDNNAKTKWSNFFYGLVLLIFMLFLSDPIQKIPLCALAVLLVYIGFKLASPRVFKEVYSYGIEQIIFFTGTLLITLLTDVLIGIFGGLALAIIVHIILAKVSPITFFKMVFKADSTVLEKDGIYKLKIKGIANFLATLKINKLLVEVPPNAIVHIDLSEAKLVDFSIMERLADFRRTQKEQGGEVQIIGLEKHVSSSKKELSLKMLNR